MPYISRRPGDGERYAAQTLGVRGEYGTPRFFGRPSRPHWTRSSPGAHSQPLRMPSAYRRWAYCSADNPCLLLFLGTKPWRSAAAYSRQTESWLWPSFPTRNRIRSRWLVNTSLSAMHDERDDDSGDGLNTASALGSWIPPSIRHFAAKPTSVCFPYSLWAG